MGDNKQDFDLESQPFLADGGDKQRVVVKKRKAETHEQREKRELRENEAKLREDENIPESDYVEMRQFCFCFSVKCGLIFFGVLMLLDLFWEFFNAFEIATNANFEFLFAAIYFVAVFLLFVCLCVQFYFWCAKDTAGNRSVPQWSFLAASIVMFLLALWIAIYVEVMYGQERVWTPVYEKNDNPNTEEGENSIKVTYRSITRSNYIFGHIVGPLIMGGAYLLFFFAARGWAKKHEN